jgi:hypothetical protein
MGFRRTIKQTVRGTACDTYGGEKQYVWGLFCMELEEKGRLRRCGLKRENNIEMDMNVSEWESVH